MDEKQAAQLVPKPIYNSIWAENMSFFKDKNIFDHDYFDFLWSFIKLDKAQPVEGTFALPLFHHMEFLVHLDNDEYRRCPGPRYHASHDACDRIGLSVHRGDSGPCKGKGKPAQLCVAPQDSHVALHSFL